MTPQNPLHPAHPLQALRQRQLNQSNRFLLTMARLLGLSHAQAARQLRPVLGRLGQVRNRLLKYARAVALDRKLQRQMDKAAWIEVGTGSENERVFMRKAGYKEQHVTLTRRGNTWDSVVRDNQRQLMPTLGLVKAAPAHARQLGRMTFDAADFAKRRAQALQLARERLAGLKVVAVSKDNQFVFLQLKGFDKPVKVKASELDRQREALVRLSLARQKALERENTQTRQHDFTRQHALGYY